MLLVLCSQYSPRLSYTLSWICGQWRIPFEVTQSAEVFSKFSGPKICYHTELEGEPSIAINPSGLLSDSDIRHIDVKAGKVGDMPVLFTNETAFGFDVFSAVFYMLSRYEEYLPFQADVHGRFPAKCSIAFIHDFLRIPVVDLWVEHLRLVLVEQYRELEFHRGQFESILSYDIDQAYKYKGKSLIRGFGGMVKDLSDFSFRSIVDRFRVMLGNRKDPWDFYNEIMDKNKEIGTRTIFFFPAGSRSNYDKNFQPDQPVVSKLIQQLKVSAEIGLHPSYYSTENPALFAIEKKRLEKVTGSGLTLSRQHFLKFKLPDTYHSLNECGITQDFSMAYPEVPGFRAGTARPFCFYDLKNECTTALQIFPPCCMDSTFINYLNVAPDEVLEEMKYFLKTVAECKGVFIPIFHNDTFEDRRWLELHESILKEIQVEKYQISENN